jgi:hypothetical protein
MTFQICSHNGARAMKLVMINIITYTSKTTKKWSGDEKWSTPFFFSPNYILFQPNEIKLGVELW